MHTACFQKLPSIARESVPKTKKSLGLSSEALAAGEGFESPMGDFRSYYLMLPNAAKCCGARVLEKYQFRFCQSVLTGFTVLRVRVRVKMTFNLEFIKPEDDSPNPLPTKNGPPQ